MCDSQLGEFDAKTASARQKLDRINEQQLRDYEQETAAAHAEDEFHRNAGPADRARARARILRQKMERLPNWLKIDSKLLRYSHLEKYKPFMRDNSTCNQQLYAAIWSPEHERALMLAMQAYGHNNFRTIQEKVPLFQPFTLSLIAAKCLRLLGCSCI
jgi:hypothetical protein